MGCSASIRTTTSSVPVVLTSRPEDGKATLLTSRPEDGKATSMTSFTHTSGGSIYITKQLSIPLAMAFEKANWKVGPWKFKPEKEVPEIGDVRIFEGEYPGLGAVKTFETLKKYIHTEWYYEHEYHLTESNLLPGVERYIGNVTIFFDIENPGKSFVAYRATWDKGEVSDAFTAACQGAIDMIDAPASVTPSIPMSAGSIYITKQLSVPLSKAFEKANWKVAPWKVEPEKEVPEIGDVRIFEGEFPGLGAVKTLCTLKKYINTERYYEHEYHITESNLLPGVEGYIGNVTVFSDAENPEKSFVAYRATWDKGEVSDVFKAACKGAIDMFDAP